MLINSLFELIDNLIAGIKAIISEVFEKSQETLQNFAISFRFI